MIAFVDVETGSGRDRSGDLLKDGNIMQIACVVTDGKLKELGRFESKCLPIKDPSPEALRINKLDNWESFPPSKLVSNNFMSFLKSFGTEFIFAAHNVPFDYKQIIEWCKINGSITEFNQYVLPYGHYCTKRSALFLYKRGLIKYGRQGLSSLCMYFKIPNNNHHDAMNDVLVTIELAKKLAYYENQYLEKQDKIIGNPMLDSSLVISDESGIYINLKAIRSPKALSIILKNIYLRYIKGMAPWALEMRSEGIILSESLKNLSRMKDTINEQASLF